jgi:hypothetical protein
VKRFERAIRQLASAFEAAAGGMLGVVLTFIGRRTEYSEAIEDIDAIAEALEEDSHDWIDDTLPEVYAEGLVSADQVPFEEIHDETLEIFIERLKARTSLATQNISEDAKQQIRVAAQERLAAALEGQEEQAAGLEEDLRSRSIKFVDSGGREWDTRAYAEMLLRTHIVEVLNQATILSAQEQGSPGVRVFDGGEGDTDPPCKQANGQRWSLRYARANRLEHPNCRRSFEPLPADFHGELDR